jgi:hypothetical protein
MLNDKEYLHIRESNGAIEFYHSYEVILGDGVVTRMGTTNVFYQIPFTEQKIIEIVENLERYTQKKRDEIRNRYSKELGWKT